MTVSDLNTHISFLTKTNTTSFPAADRLIMVNDAYRRVTSLIMTADGRWEWDDNNNTTDLPQATTALVSGQADYTLASAHLRITGMEVKNSSGTWFKLYPIDKSDWGDKNISVTQQQTLTGLPTEYDLLGASIVLYPTPNYSQAASLKVHFTRGPAEFTSGEVSTGTKEPGFSSLYHTLLSYWPSYNYAVANGLPQANGYMAEIQRMEDALVKDYSRRDPDERKVFTMQGAVNFK